MKSTLCIALVFFAIVFSANGQDIKLLETGEFHGEEVEAVSGEVWLGLFKQGGRSVLLPSILSVEYVYDPIVDPVGGSSGKAVKLPGLGEPLFLITGKGFVQGREVQTILSDQRTLSDGFDYGFDFHGSHYSIKVENDSKTEANDSFVSSGARVVVRGNGIKQVIYDVGECSFCVWDLKWVGDLDGDRIPDFYMNLTYHYNVTNMKLFLSSHAESGKLVKEVAEFVTTGC